MRSTSSQTTPKGKSTTPEAFMKRVKELEESITAQVSSSHPPPPSMPIEAKSDDGLLTHANFNILLVILILLGGGRALLEVYNAKKEKALMAKEVQQKLTEFDRYRAFLAKKIVSDVSEKLKLKEAQRAVIEQLVERDMKATKEELMQIINPEGPEEDGKSRKL